MLNKFLSTLMFIFLGFGVVLIGTSLLASNNINRSPEESPRYGEKQSGSQYNYTIRLHKNGYFFCTAAVIDGNYALTAAHCVTEFGMLNTEDIQIFDDYRLDTHIIANAVASDTYRDVAVIKGDFSKFKSVPVDFAGKHIKVNMPMLSCGFPAGQLQLFCADLTMYSNRNFQYRTKGPPIFKGMSGGPVIDASGYLVGVNSAVTEEDVIISPVVGALDELGL